MFWQCLCQKRDDRHKLYLPDYYPIKAEVINIIFVSNLHYEHNMYISFSYQIHHIKTICTYYVRNANECLKSLITMSFTPLLLPKT